jgi:hypothetical protein
MSKHRGLVLVFVLCAVLTLGFVAGKTADRPSAPPYTLTAVPLSPGFPEPTFLLADSQSPTIRVIRVTNALPKEIPPRPKLESGRYTLVLMAEFDLAKLRSGDATGEPAANNPPAVP